MNTFFIRSFQQPMSADDLSDNLLKMLPQPPTNDDGREENGNSDNMNAQMAAMQRMLAEQAAKMREMENTQKEKERDLERERQERRKRLI